MVVAPLNGTAGADKVRHLKPHKKSRKGCSNCKLRKVKCDEGKPTCERCRAYGTLCDYESPSSELQAMAYGVHHVIDLKRPALSQNQMVLGIINSVTNSSCDQYSFSRGDLDVLYKFHSRTILSLGPASIQQANQYIYSRLTYSHSFLFHCVLTLTIVHDQYLGIGSTTDNAAASAFHWSQAAALLNGRLSAGPEDSERDALWACAALLGALAFCSVEGSTPEDVWPLNPQVNLDWLRLTEGKKEIWRIAEPTREDSIFKTILPDFLRYASPNAASFEELTRLPSHLVQLCHFEDESSHRDNPYYNPASVLAQTMDIECTRENVGRFLSIFGCMSTEYKRLLHKKDPVLC